MWNWQQTDWPNFDWDPLVMVKLEEQFLNQAGMLVGATKHFDDEEKSRLTVELMTGEALKSSEIEGEYLSRDSVQSSIQRHLGLKTDHRRVAPAEQGIADLMIDLYEQFDQPLTVDKLFYWHTLVTKGRLDLADVGCYRTSVGPMQVVSGRLDRPKVHFEAPPSSQVKREMRAFMDWWGRASNAKGFALPALTRASLAHLYFVCIHPFEDGNGRLARALAVKSLAESQGSPVLLALSQTIESSRKLYYSALERNNKSIEVTDWLLYFGETILRAQLTAVSMVDFLIEKAKLYERLSGQLNERQLKVLARVFKEGIEGFKGGVSAEKYISLTGASRATATRDLQAMVDKGAFIKTGALKSTRYWLNMGPGYNAVCLHKPHV